MLASADSLLEAATPHVAEAIEKAAEAKEAAIARAQELLAALDAALEEAATLTAERSWLVRLDGRRRRVEPFRGESGDPALGQLRSSLQGAFAGWQAEHERRQAELDRDRRFEADEEAERLRHAEQALREDRERSVVFEGGSVIDRGGRPVGSAGDSQDEEPKR